MTVKLSSLKADLARETAGDWIEFPEWANGDDRVEFKVSSLLLPAYTVARDLLMQKLSRQHKGKPVPRDVLTPEVGKLYAKHILHGWRGLDVDYSPAKAAEILGDPEYRAIVAAVEWCAAKISDIQAEFVEDAGKNSGKPSAKS